MSLSAILDGFSEQYEPKHSGFAPDISELSNGNYDMQIVSAKPDQTVNGDDIFKLTMCVLPGSYEVKKDYWFTGQGDVNRLGADLMALGFSTATIKELQQVLAGIESGKINLAGIKFRANKGSYTGKKDGKTIHTFKVISRLNGNHNGNGTPAPKAAVAPPSYEAADDNVPF